MASNKTKYFFEVVPIDLQQLTLYIFIKENLTKESSTLLIIAISKMNAYKELV